MCTWLAAYDSQKKDDSLDLIVLRYSILIYYFILFLFLMCSIIHKEAFYSYTLEY